MARIGRDLDGRIRFWFHPGDLPEGRTIESTYGGGPVPANGHGRQKVREAIDFLHSEEHRRQRQGTNASEQPAYTAAELKAQTQAQVGAELPSIQAATTAKRIDGWQKPKPERETQEPWFTRSQLEALHPDDVQRRWESEIEPAWKSGLIDFSK